MKKSMAALFGSILTASMLFSPGSVAAAEVTTTATYGVQYKTHIQDYGWESAWKSNGALSGTVGESKRLEALRVELTGADLPFGANIQTYVHVQNEGDLGPFDMGSLAGTEGKGLRLERITLNLRNLPDYQLRYNVQVQNVGWLRDENDVSTWFVSGESAGTSGKGYRLEGIKITLVETNDAYDAYKKALAAVKEENYTSLSWIYYQAVVEAYAVTEDDEKETIIEATEAVLDAQKSLVRGSDLSVYNQAISSVNEIDYTPESWESYQDTVWSNYVTKDDSQAVVNAAVKNIQAAQKRLQRKVNLTRYNELLAGVIESDYLPESWAEYQQVLANNVVTEANTQTAINEAVKNIEEAQKKMVRRLDFTGYKSLLAAVKEADYTTESWAAYQDVVDANVMSENNTQSQIEAAMAKIAAAQKNLIKAADLSAYEAALAAVSESDYTPASWLVYQNVVKTNKVTAASGQTAIDAATEKIVAAQLKLVGKADFTAYETALAAVNQNDYTPLSWMAYQKVVTANRASAAAAQDAVDKATDKILAAQLNLVLKGNLTNYKNALAAVKQANYTTETWAEYQKVVKANGMTANSSQSEIDLATENILAAQENLVLKDGDLSAYEKALSKVKEADYTAASWKLYQQVVEANVVDGENTQTEIDQATKNILAAQANLVKKGDLTAYNIALAGLTEADYTASSWLAYQAVVKANVRTVEDGQVKIDLSTEKILTAQKSLVKAGDLTAYSAALAAVRKENYTAASWATYQTIVNANVRTRNDTQSLIDLSTKRITDAQSKLVRKYDMSAYNGLLAAVKQADYTPASWTTYQTVVKANVVTAASSAAQIQAAIEKIEAAQAKLVKVVDLTAYNNALEAAKEVEYIPETWTAYQLVVKANVVTTANTQTQIDTATKNIIAAQKEVLKRKVNLTRYLELLAGAVEYDYSPASWAIYQKILSENVMSENNTQTEVDAAVKKIEIAQNNLARRLDYTKYKELLAATEGKEDLYTSVSWGIYQKVVTENTLTMDKEKDTQTAIDKAVINIEAAQKKLVKAGDLTAYNLVLKAVKREDYTTATWDVYLKVLEANEMTKNHSQADIDAATEKIRLAQLKLAKAATDIAEYNRLTGLLPEDYTSVSWAVYQKVLDANYVTPQDGQTKINAAVVKLREAERKLVERADDFSEYNKALKYNLFLGGDPDDAAATKAPVLMNEGDYTTSSWAVYQKVLDANVMDLDKSQAQVNLAVANIKKAQFKLLKGGLLTRYNNLLKYNIVLGKDPDDATDTRALHPMKETEYTSTSWSIYAKVLSSNEMDRDKSQAQIDAAVVKIERAQAKLVVRGDLTAYYEILNKVKKADWTTKSWTEYEKKLTTKGYFVTPDNSQAEINRAVDLIELAQLNLLPRGNTDEYYDLLDNYTDPSVFKTAPWKTYITELAKYVVSGDNSDYEIKIAVDAIKRAQQRLNLPENTASILTAYNEALSKTDASTSYTPTSWGIYEKAIKPYLNYTKDTDQDKVNTATDKIKEAQTFLVRTNQTELNKFKDAIEMYLRNHLQVRTAVPKPLNTYVISGSSDNKETWEAYVATVEKYAKAYSDSSWQQTAINDSSRPEVILAAVADINKAISKLRPVAPNPDGISLDYTAYDKALNESVPWRDDLEIWTETMAKVAPRYTQKSYDDYVRDCNSYEILNRIESAPGVKMDQTKIENATAFITNAQKTLWERAEEADINAYNNEVAQFKALVTSKGNYTSATWGLYETTYLNVPSNLNDLQNLKKTDCQKATGDLMTARLGLKFTAAFVGSDLTTANLSTDVVKTTNLLARAQNLLKDKTKYKVEVKNLGNANVDANGIVTGNPGDAVVIGFRVSEIADLNNYHEVKITGITVSAPAATAATGTITIDNNAIETATQASIVGGAAVADVAKANDSQLKLIIDGAAVERTVNTSGAAGANPTAAEYVTALNTAFAGNDVVFTQAANVITVTTKTYGTGATLAVAASSTPEKDLRETLKFDAVSTPTISAGTDKDTLTVNDGTASVYVFVPAGAGLTNAVGRTSIAVGADATTTASTLAAAIAGKTNVGATNGGTATVTITAKVTGTAGNAYTLAKSDGVTSNFTLSGTNLAGGV
ncbi:MAG: hypothetical protein BI182_05800 [Acetobacterium sp. MES1]|uniref:hypothetical protein n=1 Tax=Acetobacterium sp. MES1 TaxID=1899015 RepID=UPI000B9C94ED|nr:hypothetical protein [Acetobacterium sp. MES1]OXS25243.1 MAG: hypothetical protein BI182_05800 [Acetobacterium sp. MES1]